HRRMGRRGREDQRAQERRLSAPPDRPRERTGGTTTMDQAVAPQAAKAAPPTPPRAKETGVPDNKQFMHPTLMRNYGNWKCHDRPRPGVLHHVSHSGDQVWTVRAATERQMGVHTIRKLCDIADQYAEGHVRFTIRSNIEFMV